MLLYKAYRNILKIKSLLLYCAFLILIVLLNSCKFYKETLNKPELFEYNIICDKTEFEQLYYIDFHSNRFINIKICYKNDTIPARLRIRGDTSRDFPKKSFKIECDSIKLPGHPKVLNFNAEYTDKGYIREYLSSKIMQASGQPCFDTEFAQISLNGQFFGLYLRVENVDKEFLKKRNLNPNSNLYKASKDGACLSIYDELDVKWEKKTNKKTGMDDLKMLIDSLNSVSDFDFYRFVQTNFDYDKLINIIAMNMLLQNKSTYYHNYYLYHDLSTGKWTMFPWDMDKTLSSYDYDYVYNFTSSSWASDNPLIERALLCSPMFDDIQKRIKQLGKQIFNKRKIWPIIGQIEKLLECCVSKDTTDDTDLGIWLKTLDKEKETIAKQVSKLDNQFKTYPKSFYLRQNDTLFYDQVPLKWDASVSPKGLPISYNLYYCEGWRLVEGQTTIIKDIKDTSYLLTGLKNNTRYCWAIVATDGKLNTDGFNTRNEFLFKESSVLPDTISQNLTLTNDSGPYIIKNDLLILKGCNLNIDSGVLIKINRKATIIVYGNIIAKGTLDQSVKLMPINSDESWGIIDLKPSSSLNFSYVHMNEGNIYGDSAIIYIENSEFKIDKKILWSKENGVPHLAFFKAKYGSLFFSNNSVICNSTGEGMLFFFGKALVENSTFTNMPDAIEFIKLEDGIIRDNKVYNSGDDAIDMNSCINVLIENNILQSAKDKGISVGEDNWGRASDKIMIKNNLISGCSVGVGINSNSKANISNCTFLENDTAIKCFEKRVGKGGGDAYIEHSVFYNSRKTNIYYDIKSIISIENSVCNTETLIGNSNRKMDIEFSDIINLDYTLKETLNIIGKKQIIGAKLCN